MSKGAHTFAKLLTDWIPVFTAGAQTDSKGQTKAWTEADLDQMVSNFDASDSAPIVIGHPQHNSPAWGWVEGLKRDGASLFAKFRDVDPKFIAWGQAGHIRNRSVKILNGTKGFKLGHVGFLGAMPPAVEGMEQVEFAAGGETYDFSLETDRAMTYGLRGMARALRSLREWIVGEKGQEAADKALPVWPIEDMERAAAEAEAAQPNTFNAPEDSAMPFSQADLDAAVARAREEERSAATQREQGLRAQLQQSEFSARLAANREFIDGLVSDAAGNVRLTPADAAGWAEALTYAQGLDGAEFTFSADGAEQKPKLYEFMRARLSALKPTLQLRRERATDDPPRVDATDAVALAAAASEYVSEQAARGITINIAQAVDHIKQTRAAK